MAKETKETEIEQFAKNRFITCTTAQLINSCRTLGIEYQGKADSVMRLELCTKLSLPTEFALYPTQGQMQESNVRQISKPSQFHPGNFISLRTNPPSVSGSSQWKGRRRVVMLHRTEKTNGCDQVLVWEGYRVHLREGMRQSIPYPHWHLLANTCDIYLEKVKMKRPGTEEQYTEDREYSVPRYSFQDFGDDPETKDLPTSLLEWLQWQAMDNNYHRKTDRETLIRILSLASDGVKDRKYCESRPDSTLREDLLISINLSNILDDEYNEMMDKQAAQ